MKRSDSDGSHLALNEADPSTLSRALSVAIHVAGNESFDPCNGCEHRPGGADLRDRLEERWNELILSTSGVKAKPKPPMRGFKRSTRNTRNPDGITTLAFICGKCSSYLTLS